jgi:uncharacterized protein with ATP-grasp and redox domains
MQDRPTASELLKAAREFCERELGPELDGRLRFQVRVLQNILGILEREWSSEESAVRTEWQRLRELLDDDEDEPSSFADLRERVREMNADLAERIRSGAMDDRWDETLRTLTQTVDDKLAIANPRHSEAASSDT